MPLVISVSGVRGTIGTDEDKTKQSLTPDVLLNYVSAYGQWICKTYPNLEDKAWRPTIVVGRDGRISGEVVSQFVISTLRFSGINVIDLDYSTTPTVEVAVERHNAQGGIVLSASHNPKEYNALKLLNHKGEFVSAAVGEEIKKFVQESDFNYANVMSLGDYRRSEDDIEYHVQKTCELELVDVDAIRASNFHVIVDCINSTGAISIPPLLDALGVTYELLNADVSGDFAHEAEPLPKNLGQLSEAVGNSDAVLGIAVDPDVDRLVLVSEDGSMFGEEYTLVAVADYILKHKKGAVVNNLSSSRALSDIAKNYQQLAASGAVGEVHVVNKMKELNAVVGGEGNGGIIYPELHYGRDSIVGIALFLSHLAETNLKASEVRNLYPNYTIVKSKMKLNNRDQVPAILKTVAQAYKGQEIDYTDGVKVDMDQGWVHLRASNTEPIVRVIAESKDESSANELAAHACKIMEDAMNSLV